MSVHLSLNLTMSNNIQFSIIIPAYNEEAILPACVGALKKQKGGFDYEIIVVDNNSTDNTKKVAQEMDIKVISEEKQGVGWARRTGTEQAKGKYILNIDADSKLPNDYLLNVYKRFQLDPTLACLGGQFFFYDASQWKNFLRFFLHYILWFFVTVISRGKIGPMGNNMIFKKELYKKTTGFDPNVKFGEDADLSRKLSKFGKVKLDMSLHSYISSRRFKVGRDLVIYFWNFLKMCFKGGVKDYEMPHIN